jgi:hypothetical protein
MGKFSKPLILFLVILLSMPTTSFANSDGKFKIIITGNLLFAADNNYKDVYGGSLLYPGMKVGYRVLDKVYLWGGYDYLKKNGTTPVLEEDAKSIQHFISLCGGYLIDLSNTITVAVVSGLIYIFYTEEAMGDEISDSAIGVRLNGAMYWYLGKKVFTTLSLGYIYSSDTVNEVKIRLGGFQLGIGIGITL